MEAVLQYNPAAHDAGAGAGAGNEVQVVEFIL